MKNAAFYQYGEVPLSFLCSSWQENTCTFLAVLSFKSSRTGTAVASFGVGALSSVLAGAPLALVDIWRKRVTNMMRSLYPHANTTSWQEHSHLCRSSSLRIQQHIGSCSFLWSWCIVLHSGKDCSDTRQRLPIENQLTNIHHKLFLSSQEEIHREWGHVG